MTEVDEWFPATERGRGERLGYQQVGTGLYRLQRLLASRRVSSALADAAQVPVSQQGLQVIRALRDGEQHAVAAAARGARMDVGATSRQLRSLETDGLVQRASSPDNASVVLVSLTEVGVGVSRRVEKVRNRHLYQALAGWSDSEREQLGDLLIRLVDDLQATPYEYAKSTMGETKK